ncbi:MAG: DUF1428 domain-containing protein [Gammaproteobacteria bacterium]
MYIDSYVLAVPEQNKDRYLAAAESFAAIAKDCGVLEIVESWEAEVADGDDTDFRKAVKAQAGEKIVSSWVIWPNREAAHKGKEAMMKDERMAQMGDMPFDGKRMIFGSFEPILTVGRK